MSEKEAKDYFKKLMNDTQNKIDDVNNEKSINENVKIDNNEHNQEQNMSESEPKKSKNCNCNSQNARWERSRDSITTKSFQNRS